MSSANNLHNYLRNIADGIREVKEATDEKISINAQNFPLEIRNLKPRSPFDKFKAYLQSIDLRLPEEDVEEIYNSDEIYNNRYHKSILQMKMSNGEYCICVCAFNSNNDNLTSSFNSQAINVYSKYQATIITWLYYDNYIDNNGRPWAFNSFPSGYKSSRRMFVGNNIITIASYSQNNFEDVKLIPFDSIIYDQPGFYETVDELLTGIADAIREVKGYPLTQKINAQKFAEEIRTIEIEKEPIVEPFDIFNHGDIIGRNPDITFYYGTHWAIDNTRIYKYNYYSRTNVYIRYKVDTKIYKKLCFEADGGNYSTDTVFFKAGLVAESRYGNNKPPDNDIIIDREVICIDGSTKTNYTNTEPWYTLPRTVIEVDLKDFPEEYGYIAFYVGYTLVNIYSVWLE